MDYTIKLPQELKAKVMLWTDLNFHAMTCIAKAISVPELEEVLTGLLRINLSGPKKEVLLEIYTQAVLFSRQHKFKNEQTSALISIIKSIHEANVDTPFNNIDICLQYSKDLLLCHSVRRPPFSLDIFNIEQVDLILHYIYENYLRHYKLYKYIFTPQIKLDLTLTYPGIPETPSVSSVTIDNENEDGQLKDDMEETSAAQPDYSSVSPSELKTLITQEVKQQMKVVSGHLDQTIKDKIAHHNTESVAAPSGRKAKK